MFFGISGSSKAMIRQNVVEVAATTVKSDIASPAIALENFGNFISFLLCS